MIQAQIVRIMKRNRVLSKKDIMREVYATLGCRLLSLKVRCQSQKNLLFSSISLLILIDHPSSPAI